LFFQGTHLFIPLLIIGMPPHCRAVGWHFNPF
jgi:hypothetical protein